MTDLRANIREFTSLYGNQLAQLASTDLKLVETALQQPAEDAVRERHRQWVIADFARRRKEGRTPTEAELLARCSAAPAESVAGTSEPPRARSVSDGGKR